MFDGTFYLTGIDEKYKRFYGYKGLENIPESGASIKSAKTSSSSSSTALRLNAMKMHLFGSSTASSEQAK